MNDDSTTNNTAFDAITEYELYAMVHCLLNQLSHQKCMDRKTKST